MLRTSLILGSLLAFTAPLFGQSMPAADEWNWTSDRPDGAAQIGIFGSRMMSTGEFELSYRFLQNNFHTIYGGTQPLDDIGLAGFTNRPTTRTERRQEIRVAYGVSESLSLIGRTAYVRIKRQTELAGGDTPFERVEGIGDVEVAALLSMYAQGPYRLHAQFGAIAPTGKNRFTKTRNGAQVVLPYDMSVGAGTFGAVVGIGGNAQNETGSVGGHFRMQSHFGKKNGYQVGDSYEGSGYAAYQVNRAVAVSAGVRWFGWSSLSGSDAERSPLTADPHNQIADKFAGQRLTLPLGVSAVVPGDGFLGGDRLFLEGVYTLHNDHGGAQLALEYGLNFGWSRSF